MADYIGISTLLDIASTGHLADLKNLLYKGCFVNMTDITGKTALWIAIERGNSIAVETLLLAGADVNKTCNSRRTPLMFAAHKGYTAYVQALLVAGANIDSVDSHGMSALMIAAQRGDLDCLHKFILAGASLNLQDIRGKTAIMIAVEENRCDCLKCLIDAGANIQYHDFKFFSPLMIAVLENCERCLQTLIQAGAKVDAIGWNGKTALEVAVERESTTIPFLIQMGADVNQKVSRGKTPTMLAASKGFNYSLQLLVQAGADLDKVDEDGQTALMIAAYEGYVECVECLVSGGARQELQDTKGRTALMLAASKGHYECLQVLQTGASWKDLQCKEGKTALIYATGAFYEDSVHDLILSIANTNLTDTSTSRNNFTASDHSYSANKCVRILLKAGANPSICDWVGMYPLMYAAKWDTSTKSLKPLLDAGADINMIDKSGTTALAHAASHENRAYVRKLVDAGALVNTVSKSGETPLLYLAKKQPSTSLCDTIAYLLDYGAEINVQDKEGMTPLMCIARTSRDLNVMSLLLNQGAKIDMKDNRGFSALHHTIETSNRDSSVETTRFLLDHGANPNITTANGKSAISLAIQKETYNHLVLLVKYIQDPSISWEDFCCLLNIDNKKMLQFMVLNGAIPSEAFIHQNKTDEKFSILMTVLNLGRLLQAKYFLATGYINHFDTIQRKLKRDTVSVIFFRNPNRRKIPMKLFLESGVYSQPWPLVKLCFVAVSSLVGGGPERKERVRKSRLPDRIQRMLLFQEPIAKLCVKNWESISFCFDPVDYEKLPKPRPLLFYWPFGRDLTPCECSECNQTGFKFV